MKETARSSICKRLDELCDRHSELLKAYESLDSHEFELCRSLVTQMVVNSNARHELEQILSEEDYVSFKRIPQTVGGLDAIAKIIKGRNRCDELADERFISDEWAKLALGESDLWRDFREAEYGYRSRWI